MPSHRFITFRSVTLLFILGLTAFAWFHHSAGLSCWYLVLWIHLFLLVQFCGAYFIGMNFHLDSLNALPAADKKVLLTFDDGPHGVNTARVLEVLKRHEVRAVFFLIGKNIRGREGLVRQMVAEGHRIGNHSFSHHRWIDVWPTRKVSSDLAACQQEIEAYQPGSTLFRPPYGVTNPNIARAVRALGLRSIGWNIRSYDTSIGDVQKINERILSRLKPGAIILLHDRLDLMPGLLDELIPAIRAKGYSFADSIGA